MRIGVTGPRGQLGSELVRQGCLPIEGRFLDQSMWEIVRQFDSDVIINCAAMTNVDRCEQDAGPSSFSNAMGVDWLNYLAPSCYLVQISTDYIFDGIAGPYAELDNPNPQTIYGWTKLGGELITRRHQGPWLIIRIATPFGLHPTKSNFVTKVVDKLQQPIPILLFPPDLISTPSYIPHLARGIIEAVQRQMTGVLHLAGNRVMRLGDFAKEIAQVIGANPDKIEFDDAITPKVPRPQRGGLKVERAMKEGVFVGDALEGLREMLTNGL